jgi:hypothetical protein
MIAAQVDDWNTFLLNILIATTRVFDEISFRETGYETIFVFRENDGRVSRVSQFCETADITKEMFSRITKIAKTKKTWSENTKFNYFSFNSCEDAH